jgi:hypothetical protein
MSSYTYSYNENNSTLTVTKDVEDNSVIEKLYVKPSYDFGVLNNARNYTPETDYLDALRLGWITATIGSRNFTLSLEVGSSYNKGIPLKINNDDVALPLGDNESIEIILDTTSASRGFRINFEVM